MKQRSTSSTSTPLPWVSGLLALLCLVFAFHTQRQFEYLGSAVDEALADSKAYFLSHPYLDPGPALAQRIDPVEIERLREEYEQQRIARASLPIPEGVTRRQQAMLDQRISDALGRQQRLDAQRFVVVAGGGFGAAWFAYPIVHPEVWQLLGNVLVLLFFGVYLERSFGRCAYTATLLLATFAGAAAFHAAVSAPTPDTLAGSAPLAAALVAAFALRRRSQWKEGFYAVGVVLGTLWVALPPWAGLRGSYASYSLVVEGLPLAANQLYWALLGGALAGIAATLGVALLGIDGERAGDTDSEVQRHPLYRRARRARRAGRPREARELLTQLVGSEPQALEAVHELWEVAIELGRPEEACSAMLRAIRIEMDRGLSAAAVDHWVAIAEAGIPPQADPALLIRISLLLRDQGKTGAAVDALRCALERSGDRESHAVASRIAKAARGLDHGVAETAAWRALASFELDLAERQMLEELLAEVLPETSSASASASASASETPDGEAEDESKGAGDAKAEAPLPIELGSEGRTLQPIAALPLQVGNEGLEIEIAEGRKKLLRYERIDALAVAAVEGLGPKPVLVIDLVLNWMTPVDETLRVIRLRTDRFDPRRLVDAETRVDALRAFTKVLLAQSRATALPDEDTVLGRPFAAFDSLASYERTILAAQGEPPDGRVQGLSA